MSKKVKNLITKELTSRFERRRRRRGHQPARDRRRPRTTCIRRRLHEKGLRMTVVKNTLARRAVGDESKLKGFDSCSTAPAPSSTARRSIVDDRPRCCWTRRRPTTRSNSAASSSTAKSTSATRASRPSASCRPAKKRSASSWRCILGPGPEARRRPQGPGGKLGGDPQGDRREGRRSGGASSRCCRSGTGRRSRTGCETAQPRRRERPCECVCNASNDSVSSRTVTSNCRPTVRLPLRGLNRFDVRRALGRDEGSTRLSHDTARR